ncbi:Flp pilus assembly protein CpaB [Halobacillus yeomjeoni]|uniref:Flp pilus assembly protein CpaB n=1 Tax=Halobacillus yeomjeoni TaxID=311194 RepID=A0A931HTL7_9BACI|nr:Flp pilus assembly protein CpaB [Halobacillus yeomjeoni]MBH0229188.1 Flp pilus assembly protein CpaB [Halobacillus yeomjeoni]
MRSKIILFIALIMGGVTTFLFFNYMKQFDTAKAINDNTTEVVVASGTIFENERISPDKMKVVQLPTKGLHSQVVKSLEEVDGKYATAAIETDEPLLLHRIKDSKEEQLFVSRKVKEGYRGVSIGVDLVRSVSNLIEPEDVVDVIASETLQGEDKEKIQSRQILSDVTVLAIGRRMSEVKSDQEEYVEYTSVTLELKPADAVKLVEASEKGNIHLTVHSRINKGENEDKGSDSKE